MPLKPADHHWKTDEVRKKSKKWIIIILAIAVVIIVGAVWIFSVKGNIDNSAAMKAESVDYLIKVNDSDETEFILLRTRNNGKITEISIPLNSSVNGEDDIISLENTDKTLATLASWFNMNTDDIYFLELDEDTLKNLSSKLGNEVDTFSEFIDSLAGRGFGFFDYFKVNNYLDSFNASNYTNVDSGSLANFINRMSNSRINEIMLEGLTEYPVEIYTEKNGEPKLVYFIQEDSIEKAKEELQE
jgi:low affinity Fe/Cu permease